MKSSKSQVPSSKGGKAPARSDVRVPTHQELFVALRLSVALQSHYAKLLNMHDDGERLLFDSPEDWIARLRATGGLPL